MNDIIKNIKERRSVRGFDTGKQLTDAELNEITDCALYAPLAVNTPLWHFSVIQNKEILNEIISGTIERLKKSDSEHVKMRLSMPNFSPFYGAPTVIAVSGDKSSPYAESNCGAAIQNMLLCAKSLGISSCWIGMTNEFLNSSEAAEILKKIDVPDNYKIVGCVALGHALNVPSAPDKHFDIKSELVTLV